MFPHWQSKEITQHSRKCRKWLNDVQVPREPGQKMTFSARSHGTIKGFSQAANLPSVWVFVSAGEPSTPPWSRARLRRATHRGLLLPINCPLSWGTMRAKTTSHSARQVRVCVFARTQFIRYAKVVQYCHIIIHLWNKCCRLIALPGPGTKVCRYSPMQRTIPTYQTHLIYIKGV